jgi:hypothetical protein
MNPNNTTTMTPQEINRRIAEACGWKPHADGVGFYQGNHPLIRCGVPIPNYHGDLNAMHEAEKVLGKTSVYSNRLQSVIGAPNKRDYWRISDFELCTATAAQRAEAFLKTLSLWNEDDTK